ncbi:MAG: hypothetical protein ACREHF_13675 [Rhizomicrobium sp.]
MKMSGKKDAAKKIDSRAATAARISATLATIPKPADGLKFKNGQFDGIDLKTALRILSSSSKTFGHNDVLFAGLCEWLITPRSNKNIADAMVLETFRQYARAEAEAIPSPTPGNIWFGHMQMSGSARHLVERIYFSIGAASAIRAAYTRAPERSKDIKRALPQIRLLVATARVLHYHAVKLVPEQGKISRPNYPQAAEIAGKLGLAADRSGRLERSTRSVNEYWKHHYASLPLLYAATLIKFDNASDATLFDKLMSYHSVDDHDLTYEATQPHIKTWFGYARYLRVTVFDGMPLSKAAKKQFPRFSVPAKEVSEPTFSGDQSEVIITGFRAKSKQTYAIA